MCKLKIWLLVICLSISCVISELHAAMPWSIYNVNDFSRVLGSHNSDLNYTDDDVKGFANYLLNTSKERDYVWFSDNGVQKWMFSATYDSYNRYGIDSSVIAYVSSHGGSGDKYNNYIWMGSPWGNTNPSYILPSEMKLGDGKLRYFFMSTCNALRREHLIYHWGNRVSGIRMMFGFNSESFDSPSAIGKLFWEEWKTTGRTHKDAWIDASWKVSHTQSPLVLGIGSSAADAGSRLKETSFSTTKAGTSYFSWSWRDASSRNRDIVQKIKRTSEQNEVVYKKLVVKPLEIDAEFVLDEISNNGQYEIKDFTGKFRIIKKGRTNNKRDAEDSNLSGFKTSLSGSDLENEDTKSNSNINNSSNNPISNSELNKIADDLTRKLFNRTTLTLQDIAYNKSQTSDINFRSASEEKLESVLFDYTNTISGLPVVTPYSDGRLLITVDPYDGSIKNVKNSLIETVSSEGKSNLKRKNFEAEIAKYEAMAINQLKNKYNLPVEYIKVIEDTSMIGYDIKDNECNLVYYGEFEVKGYRNQSVKIDVE